MKPLLFIFIVLIFTSCQKPARDNPWDSLANLDPQEWAPKNLQIESPSISQRIVSWEYSADNRIEGFKIDRKKNEESWLENYAIINTSIFSFTDTITPDINNSYTYKITAYAGVFVSASIEINTLALIPAPTNFAITRESVKSFSLVWEDNCSGEHGFYIERKHADNDWEMVSTQTSNNFVDNDFFLNTMIDYRVVTFYNNHLSEYAYISVNSQIPPPENLNYIANSTTSATISWSASLSGYSGFKIERKDNNADWVTIADNLIASQFNFTDDNLLLTTNDYVYRVYAVTNGYQSVYAEIFVRYKPSIGEMFKGGIVFYVDENNNGLVCAEFDQDNYYNWGCNEIYIGTSTAIGYGFENTEAIIAACTETGTAAQVCSQLSLNGYDDWYLPSKEELNLLYLNLNVNGIGNFDEGSYWSSSEYNSTTAWIQIFANGNSYYFSKNDNLRVRAIRSF